MQRQDALGLFFYYAGFSRIRQWKHRLQCQAVTRFLIFHDILPNQAARFRANLQSLKIKTNVIGMDDYVQGHLSRHLFNIVLTFDDGFKSWVDVALPILLELELPAIFFVSSGLLDLSPKAETEFVRSKLLLNSKPQRQISGTISSTDVETLADCGFSIGGHTLNHCDVSKMTNAFQLHEEIGQDKLKLEKLTGKPVDYFSYPFGNSANTHINVQAILHDAGYRAAVTNICGFNTPQTNPYLLHRDVSSPALHPDIFMARSLGNNDPAYRIKQWWRG